MTSQTCPYLRIRLGPTHVAQSPSPLTQPKTKQNKTKIKQEFLHESDTEHEEHHKNNKKIWVWFRLDITNPEIYGSWKSCKDQ